MSSQSLAPLLKSAEFDSVEGDFKRQFLDLFENNLRGAEREINVAGAPHLGSLSQVERHVSRDGLALLRSSDPVMRYLFKAWKARNPKRGMHFLRTYLQLIYPNGWMVEQMWHSKAKPYPTELVRTGEIGASDPSVDHYLTSRVRVYIDDIGADGKGFVELIPALRAVAPAKLVLEIRLFKRFDSNVALINGATIGSFVSFE